MRTSLTTKIITAAALCLTVRGLLAQAPAGGLPTETDPRGYKYLVPAPKYLDPKNRGALQKVTSDVRLMVTAPTAPLNDAVQKATLDSFYLQYFFPVMTTEDGLKSAASQRSGFLRDLAQAKDQAMHSYLINLAFNTMKQVVQDDGFHPAARYNAMLLISQLNDVEANTLGATQILPEAMRTALPFIYQQFKSSDSDEIKIAALLGLSRHLEFDNIKPSGSAAIPANQRAAIVKELIGLAETKDAPATRNPEVHCWMRRRAIEALTMTCLTKSDAEIAVAMERILKDESNPVNVRLAVATALGKMSLQAPVKIDAVAMAKELGYLALATCDAELTRAEAQRKADYEHYARLAGTYSGEEYSSGAGGMPGGGRMPGMPGGPGMGGEGGIVRAPLRPTPGSSTEGGYGNESGYVNPAENDPKHYQMEFLRRRIRQQLYAVQLGLTGGDDFVEPKTKGGANPAGSGASSAAGSGSNQPSEKKGMHGIAKGEDQEKIKQVYYKVRKLAEVAEQGGESEFYQFIKEMRAQLKNLELVVGKRLPPAGAAGASTTTDDAPAAKGGPPKTGPKGAAPKAPPPGKAANRARPQVFGQPRFSR
jgi:hypothetical protein